VNIKLTSGLTFTQRVVQLPVATCICLKFVSAFALLFLYYGPSAIAPSSASEHLCLQWGFWRLDKDGIRTRLRSLQVTSSILLLLCLLNFNFSVCPPASHMHHTLCPPSFASDYPSSLGKAPFMISKSKIQGFWTSTAVSLCLQCVTFPACSTNNWCSWHHGFLWCTGANERSQQATQTAATSSVVADEVAIYEVVGRQPRDKKKQHELNFRFKI
jgi:hypothetical protein